MSIHDIDLPLTHAKNSKGEWKYVRDVPNGADCGCVCPICNGDLIAKHCLNEGKTPHFAHASGVECHGAQMSALHHRAQEIIKEKKTVMAPEYIKNGNRIEAKRFEFVDVDLENQKEWPTIRPDVLGEAADGKKWAIEIFYTNEVDKIKEEKIIRNGVACFEINITNQSFEQLEDFLLNSCENRYWINNPYYDEIIQNEYILKVKAERMKIEEVTMTLLEKSAYNLPEYRYMRSRTIYPRNKPKVFWSQDKLASAVQITSTDEDNYLIYVGTRDSITRNLPYVDRELIHSTSILFLYINDLYKEETLFAGDYNYKWHYNRQYEELEIVRKPQREQYQYYISRPNKWFVKKYGKSSLLNCTIQKDCKSCVFCEKIIDYEDEKYVVCNWEKKEEFVSSKLKVEKQQLPPSESYKVEALLQSFNEEQGYSRPLACNNIIDYYVYLQNKSVLDWDNVTNRIDKCMISTDERYVIVVHHEESVLSPMYYITEFSNRKYDLLARTLRGSHDEIINEFEKIKEGQ